MYKLVAIDVDGTLVNDDKKLTNRTIEAIKKASKENVKIVISSARSFYRLKDYLEKLDLLKDEQYTICFNGAVIVQNKTKKTLCSYNFEIEEINELVNIAEKLKTNILLYSMDNVFTEQFPKVIENTKSFRNVKFDIVNFKEKDFKKDKIYKILLVNNSDNILKIRRELPKELLEKYEITSSIPECIEFVKKGITKSNALNNICEKCNINKSEVIAIGDADNDIQMIDFAGLGVAMENATDLLKEKADYITSSNNNDGVGEVIEKYILNI